MFKDTIKVYLDRLVDISNRNRSIYLPKLIQGQMIDLSDLDFLKKGFAFQYVSEILEGKKKIELLPQADPRNKQVNLVSQRLKRLNYQTQLTAAETGEKSLFMAWPFVEGKLLNDQVVRAPFLFFPVDLILEGDNWQLVPREDGAPILNKAFFLAYSKAYGTSVKELLEENAPEGFPSDITGFLNALYDFLKDDLAINFNQELYEQRLSPFPDSGKRQDEEKFASGKLKLKPYAVLGHFSQKASFLVQDYEELLNGEDYPDLEEFLSEKFAPKEEQQQIREDQLYTVFPLDASQEEVVKAVREGHSCVVEGPPGSGKSQLISNLAIDYMARGKRVLVVSQKRAALDVVHDRLSKEGFGAFLALVHDFRNDRKSLFQKIQEQINSLEHYQELNRGIDAIQLERLFSQKARNVDMLGDYFQKIKSALYNTEECGLTIKELYLGSKITEEGFEMNQYYRSFDAGRVGDFLRDLRDFHLYYRKFQNSDSFWLHRVDFSSFGVDIVNRLQEVLGEVEQLTNVFEQNFKSLDSFDPSFLFSFFEQKQKLSNLIAQLQKPDVKEKFWQLLDVPQSEIDREWFAIKSEAVLNLLQEEGVEWNSRDYEVDDLLLVAVDFAARKRGWKKHFPIILNRSKYIQIYRLLIENKLQSGSKGIQVLVKKLENRLNLNHHYTLLESKSWLALPPKPFTFPEFNHFSNSYLHAIDARTIFHEFGSMGDFLLEEIKNPDGFIERVNSLLKQIQRLADKLPYWSLYLSKIQVQHLVSKSAKESIQEIIPEIKKDFHEIVAFDRLKKRLPEQDIQVMTKLLETYPDEDFEELKKFFLAGLKKSWITHIEKKYPELKDLSSQKALHFQEEFMEDVQEKWKISKFISEIRLRENTYRNLEYNRLNNLITYRDLLHQVSKKKRIWSIKQLVEKFGDEIFRLVPCWLASPETASALFPLESFFDLVIFDESSQCYVEKGFPAMLRGKQVIVAGDSKQLRPIDLYQARIDTEEEGLEVESESLMELASAYFRRFSLQGHYRSRQQGLIYFSNKHFYEGRLKMLPDRNILNDNIPAFRFLRVDGIWHKQSNEVEAEATIKEVRRIREKNPDYKIGVVTFNFFQMELIREMLERADFMDDRLEVKNIENVQGDEFDWVIISTGYAKNKNGKLIANFGLLSKVGGANRLNVAITRAREGITLVTSLKARDFSKEQLKNEGIRRLQEYLDFVKGYCKGEPLETLMLPASRFQSSWSLRELMVGEYGGLTLEIFEPQGWMDLAIKENGSYTGALLTDDKRLHDAFSIKEAFVYHPIHLKDKGWSYDFYFSRQFYSEESLFRS